MQGLNPSTKICMGAWHISSISFDPVLSNNLYIRDEKLPAGKHAIHVADWRIVCKE